MTEPVNIDPGKPHVVVDILPTMKATGYWHITGRFAGNPNLSALQRRTGLTYSTINDLVNHAPGFAMISLDVIARLCAALSCTPNDILHYDPGNAAPMPALEKFFRANPDADPYEQSRDPAMSRF